MRVIRDLQGRILTLIWASPVFLIQGVLPYKMSTYLKDSQWRKRVTCYTVVTSGHSATLQILLERHCKKFLAKLLSRKTPTKNVPRVLQSITLVPPSCCNKIVVRVATKLHETSLHAFLTPWLGVKFSTKWWVKFHFVPKVVVCGLFSHKIVNVYCILLTNSVHAVFGLDQSLVRRNQNKRLFPITSSI